MGKRIQKKKNHKRSIPVKKIQAKDRSFLWVLLGLLLLTLLFYSQTFGFDFVYWDDDANIYENPMVTNFHWDNFFFQTKQIFTTPIIGNYNPLPIWTFGLENALYGIDDPGKIHFVNVILHLICVAMVFFVSLRLNLNLTGAAILTFLFALHPMHVESVAWVTERKDVLYASFFFGAILLYQKQQLNYKSSRQILIYILFILSLLSKIQAVTLPLVFILLDYWQDKKFSFSNIFKKWPYFLLSLAFGLLGIYFLREQGSLEANQVFGVIDRIFIGAYSLFVFTIKSIIPYQLSPLYPYPPSLEWYYYASIVVFPIYVLVMYWCFIKKQHVSFFGLAFFLANIVFLLQILGAGQGLTADRFTYVAYFGIFFIIAYYAQKLLKSPRRTITIGILSVMVISYLFLTYYQIGIWKNSETLWTKALEYYPISTLPYGNRGNYYRDQNRTRDAMKDYNQVLRIDPDNASTLNSRAKLFFTLARGRDTLNLALQDYTKAIEIEPENGEFLINRGATYARLGEMNKAFQDISRGLELKPDHAAGYSNRYVLNTQLGNLNAALQDVNAYLSIDPYNGDFLYERANVKMKLGYNDDSILDDLNAAIKLKPNVGVFHYRKAVYLLNTNRVPAAKQAYTMAVQLGYRNINPDVARILGN